MSEVIIVKPYMSDGENQVNWEKVQKLMNLIYVEINKLLDNQLTNDQLKEIIKEAIQESEIKQEKATLTIKEASDFTGIGRDKLMELAHSNSDFPAFKVGSKFLINKALLEKWLERISIEKRVI